MSAWPRLDRDNDGWEQRPQAENRRRTPLCFSAEITDRARTHRAEVLKANDVMWALAKEVEPEEEAFFVALSSD